LIKETPYQVLGLKGDFEFSDIKKNYKQLVRKYPPQTEPEMIAKIRDAYDSLTNEEYYEQSIENDLFVYTLINTQKEMNEIDNIKYLTTIFETPFEI